MPEKIFRCTVFVFFCAVSVAILIDVGHVLELGVNTGNLFAKVLPLFDIASFAPGESKSKIAKGFLFIKKQCFEFAC